MPKINVSLPDDVLKDVDRAAHEAKTSRSAFLAQAARHFLEEKEEQRRRQQQLRAVETIDRLREKFGPWDGAAEVLRWRDRH